MKRRGWLALGATGATLLLAFACSFPDVTISATVTDAGEGGPTDSGVADEASSDASLDAADGFVIAVPPDAGSDVGTDAFLGRGDAGDGGDPCDEDNDGYRRADCGAGNPGPIDCDDKDPRAKPGQDYLSDPAPSGRVNGDWNCANGVEFESKYPVVDCSSMLVALCGGTGWDKSSPGCGVVGDVVACARQNLQCVATNRTPVLQRCK